MEYHQTVPVVEAISVNGGNVETVTSRQIMVDINASDPPPGSGVPYIYLTEYVYQDGSAGWVPQSQSGWLPFSGSPSRYVWTLAPQPGMRYLQVRARDGAGNISIGQARRLINFEPPTDSIARGQTRIYRYQVAAGQSLEVRLNVQSGDADLYVWSSRSDQSVWVSNQSGDADEYVRINTASAGVYQVEVYGYSSATYQISSTISGAVAAAPAQDSGGVDPAKVVPTAPRIAVDAIPDERAGTIPDDPDPTTYIQRIYLPFIRK